MMSACYKCEYEAIYHNGLGFEVWYDCLHPDFDRDNTDDMEDPICPLTKEEKEDE